MKPIKELILAIKFDKDQVIEIPSELQLIGQGRSAAVFRVVGSMKAVKVFYSEQRDLAEKEGKIYEQLSNYVYYPQLIEVGEGYLVIEYLEGMTLYDCLVSGIPITPSMVDMVDEALNYARAKGLNPSDIHLRNIILTNDHKIKLIDVVRFTQEKECPHWPDLKRAYYAYYQRRFFPKRFPPFFIEMVIRLYRRRLLPI
ncbi:serine/threonine protein kinase [Halobacillus amylolyticus]|uniref:Serine/threonine protein kinase n=1 Tax=Halobacillus amylolyticus TaxID=2932259 RepID=A0ABY4HAP7_9BACI|nr:serine/threonine protein kinase [Halobacillus amylolyticus]UOR11774.1 serine/threonine protein kinase [Halobacillus amylolyticus]